MFVSLDIPEKPGPTVPPPAPRPAPPALTGLRERIAVIERAHARNATVKILPFRVAAIDRALPGGGLALGALHEASSAGPDTEHAAAATLFVAGILARLDGPVLWALRQADLFAPGLMAAGLDPGRVVFAEAGKSVLAVAEEGLRHPALVAVVAEVTGRLGLVASRRLQLAAEQSGVTAILVRRSRTFDDPVLGEPTAAATRWRIGATPSGTWNLQLTRCRGAEPDNWTVEACDATGRVSLVRSGGKRAA